MKTPSIRPVILCGGTGTRLWPLSRRSYPKQFLSLENDNEKSLLQKTQERILNLQGVQNPILICNEEHRFLVAEQMREINIKPEIILLEPFVRGTLPAITLAALKAKEIDPDSILLILSSDHFIEDSEKFIEAIQNSLTKVMEDRLVTFGVKPQSPSTGYGYIKIKESSSNNIENGVSIESFLEKPNIKVANLIYKDPRYFWNSGIFIFKSQSILNEIKAFEPETLTLCKKAIKEKLIDFDFQRINKLIFEKCSNLSIDVAILEKTSLGSVYPLEVNWNDIGNWESVWQISEKDEAGNSKQGKIIEHNSHNCYLRSEKRLLVTIGIKDLVVIETSDAVLVANRSFSQEIKDIVNELKKRNINEGLEHKRIYRPWGFFETFEEDPFWKIKLISVKPKASLSLQSHEYRSEHWVVVDGTAKVEVGDKKFDLNKNQSVFIPNNCKHRLTNNTNEKLSIIEVQSGTYLGEDDIIRYEDNYGRYKN